jgi:hypothetical protein
VLLKYTWSILEKHLIRRREKNKKINKTKLLRSYKRSCPSIKNNKEKGLKLHPRCLMVLKTFVIM